MVSVEHTKYLSANVRPSLSKQKFESDLL
jgi:hypothetical protein